MSTRYSFTDHREKQEAYYLAALTDKNLQYLASVGASEAGFKSGFILPTRQDLDTILRERFPPRPTGGDSAHLLSRLNSKLPTTHDAGTIAKKLHNEALTRRYATYGVSSCIRPIY